MRTEVFQRTGSSALGAVLVAALTAFVFELTIVAVYRTPAAGYLALGGALTLAAALVVGGVSRLLRFTPTLALALWVALNAALVYGAERSPALWLGLAFGGAAWAALWAARRPSGSYVAGGVTVGMAIALVAIVWPKAMPLLGLRRLSGTPADALALAVFACVLAAFSLYARLLPRRRWPSDTVLALAVLALLLALTPLFFRIRYVRLDAARASGRDEGGAALAAPGAPSILVLVLDTVRADHLSLYGHERPTTPELERFARQRDRVTVYPRAFSTGSWSVPSHASLFTGLLPSQHGAHSKRLGVIQRSLGGSGAGMVAERTLAEVMKARGYRTAAIYANLWLSKVRGFERGFDVYFQPTAPRSFYLVGERLRRLLLPDVMASAIAPYPSAGRINEEVLSFLHGCAERPCFVVANYMEAHTPFAPRKPFAGRFSQGMKGRPPLDIDLDFAEERMEYARRRYDEEIASLDAYLGDLFGELDRRGLLEGMWVVVTSDHGEAFGDHGVIKHGSSVYNDQVQIPLLIRPPAPERLPEWPREVGLVDVAATLAAVVGGGPLGGGRDLRDPATADQPVQVEFFGSWTGNTRFGPLSDVPARAVIHDGRKLIQYPEQRELYDLEADPDERSNRAFDDPGEVDRLAALLPVIDGALLAPDEGEGGEAQALTPEEREALRALGYIN